MADFNAMMAFGRMIAEEIDLAFKDGARNNESPMNRQVLALAEETGEFVQAYRRWSKQARREGTRDDVEKELSDVVITAFVTAVVLGFDDFPAFLLKRLDAILARPFIELRDA